MMAGQKGDLLARLDSYELQKELKGLMADMEKAKSQTVALGMQMEKLARGQDEQELIQVRAQLAEAKITAKSSKRAASRSSMSRSKLMNIRSPQDGVITTWEARKTLMGRPVEIGQGATSGCCRKKATGSSTRVEVPDDDMGPVLAAQSKLEADIKEGRKRSARLWVHATF